MNDMIVKSIGEISCSKRGIFIKVNKEYLPALKELKGFSHINVIWWFSKSADEFSRSILSVESPYKGSPKSMGVFATRSPQRPNPIALTTSEIIGIDVDDGLIQIAFIDAKDGSPVLDIKPYTPSLDRVEKPRVPNWCSNWPKSIEESGSFDWSSVFNF